MFIGAFLPMSFPEAREEINKSGEVICHRTSELHRAGKEIEQFDAIVVLDTDPFADQVSADYAPRCEVMRLRFDQLATLGREPREATISDEAIASMRIKPNGGGNESADEGDRPAAAEAPTESEEAQPQAPAEEAPSEGSAADLEAMKRPALLKYAASKYPSARPWMTLGNPALRQAIRELGG